MPFKNTFSQLKSQLKDLQQEGQKFLANHQSQSPSQSQPYPSQQQQYQQPPPPVPQASHPSQSGPPGFHQPAPYWQARFDPATPVGAEWEHKLGNNNGWGNNEMQHYTDDGANSF